MNTMDINTQCVYNLLPRKSRSAVNWLILRLGKGHTEQLIVNCHDGSVANIQDNDKATMFC